MDTNEPGSDYKTLLRLTLETAKEHAGASSELASEVGSMREDIFGLRSEFQLHASRETQWETTIHRLDEWLQSQTKAAQDAKAQAEVDVKKPGAFERAWAAITTSMESATTRTALLAIVIPILSVLLNKAPGCSGVSAILDAPQTPTPALGSAPSPEEQTHVSPTP